MATGRLGAVDIGTINVDTLLYTCPPGNFAVVSVTLVNRTNTECTVRLGACAATSSIAAAEFIEYEVILSAHGVLERTGIVLQAGQSVLFRSSLLGVNAVAYGIETATS